MFNPVLYKEYGSAKVPFVSTWNTANISDESSTATQVKLPLVNGGNYNFRVNWGDGNSSTITSWNQAEVTHTYSVSGNYTISIKGICKGWNFATTGDLLKIDSIQKWGCLRLLADSSFSFYGCENLRLITVSDTIKLGGVTNMTGFFQYCTNIITINNIENWNVANVTNMSYMFSEATNFNQDISSWNVSNVTNMSYMFSGTTNFNQDISSWDVSNVTNMSFMFAGVLNFNQDISIWNVSNVTNMAAMFQNAIRFNQDISGWNVSNVTNMQIMFSGATAFSQPISSWNVSNVTNMNSMFSAATAFNQPIGLWNVSKVANFVGFMDGKTNATFDHLDDIYYNWSFLTFVNTGLIINFGTVKYNMLAETYRNQLTNPPNNWTITDGGLI